MDDKLQRFTKNHIEDAYIKLCKGIVEVVGQRGFESELSKHDLTAWPLVGEHFENPPFNTIPKLDKKTIIRKGSLGNYLLNTKI